MNPEMQIQLSRIRQQALLAERPILAQARGPQSWIAQIQSWLSLNKALYRAAALNR